MKTPTMRRLRHSIPLLLALLSGMAGAVEISQPSAHENPPNGAVAGTLTVDGQKSNLRYAYLRRSHASAIHANQAATASGNICVILSNLALDDTRIDAIVDGNYQGMKKLAGVMLTIDASAPKHWRTHFLSDTGMDGTAGMTQIGGEDPKIENGHVIGKISLHNQGAAHQRAFLTYFDVPLSALDEKTRCGIHGLANFTHVSGIWDIERWSGEEAGVSGKAQAATYSGSLRVDERLGPAQFHGTLHIVVGRGIPDIDEQATLTCADDKIQLRGAVVPESPWSPDTMELELRNDRLVGDGVDERGHKQHIVLKKVR
jgi:hypothetical protein